MSRYPFDIEPPLTHREAQVAATYALLWNTKEVASRLGIAESTVKQRLERARARYHVERTGELFRAMGWLRVPEGLA